jgi:GNAT superfamily N-acetyltransferase
MVINTRRFNEDSDAGLIIDSMPKEIYFDNKESRRGRINKKWFEEFHEYLKSLFKTAHIVIATSSDDQDFILGYAIFQDSQLEFVYVKEAYRKQGIGTMLVSDIEYTSYNANNLTQLGRKILEQQAEAIGETMAKKETITTTATTAPDDRLTQNAIPIVKATFQSAILSGFNAAEFQLSTTSTNRIRKADAMWYTPHCVIIDQNKHRLIIPSSNVIQTFVTEPK